jgi:predicted alpha-1,2-mannosidase
LTTCDAGVDGICVEFEMTYRLISNLRTHTMNLKRVIRILVVIVIIAASAFAGCSNDANHAAVASGVDASFDIAANQDAADDAADAGPEWIDAERAFGLVDPFIGTGGFAFGYAALTPAAQVPNGLVRLGPDTSVSGQAPAQSHFSGYNFNDVEVRGFSHLRLVGTGAAALGNVRVLPVNTVTANPWYQYTAMDKDSEKATPGYYSVYLPEVGVTADLTATLRAGFHRYTSDAPGITLLFDPAASITNSTETQVTMNVEGQIIDGTVVYGGDFATRSGPFTLYFSATTDSAPTGVSTWNDQGVQSASTSTQGIRGGAVLEFDGVKSVELRVGLSFVDQEQARLHRGEVDTKTFEEVREQARVAWLDKLGRVRIRGGSEHNQRIFYTALYNVWRMPTRLDGADGRYRGMDDTIHQADGTKYYSDMSLWDSFRTLHPWLILVDPDLQRDCLNSLLAMKRATGYIPRWPALQTYTNSMLGTPGDQLFAESALKGIDGVDYAEAFDALWETANNTPPPESMFSGRRGGERYVELGYVPDDEYNQSVSRTLEYVWGDWALANLAEHLGRFEAVELRARSENWKNTFEADSKFMTPRNADGNFVAVPNKSATDEDHYTEGNAWHWRFYPTWHAQELAEAFGGPAAFHDALTEFFADAGIGKTNFSPLLPDRRYWHGNEHDLGAAYLFNFTDNPADVGKWVRIIQATAYGTGPDGLVGNDDGGTLSAWYLFSALGFYPVAGGDTYMLGAPLFPEIQVDLGDGKTLKIEAPGAGPDTPYVTRVRVDGEVVAGPYLNHAKLVGTTIHFDMATEPL